ncbi:OLC1v1012159C2 [Oldenlandia corymbosa var. corymbosa]|nr:OLC1v1012159C2 [Oldenlandia corymbosa var. corymbosa]
MESLNVERKRVSPRTISLMICLFLFAIFFSFWMNSSLESIKRLYVEETKTTKPQPQPQPPRFAYLISGSSGDLDQLWRVLQAVYHPWNYYVVHLEKESSMEERLELASRVEKDAIFSKVKNVVMITKANMVTYGGPTMLSNTLHACALLLKRFKDWDWFINLSATDYPLVTQDDLLHAFSGLKRDLNFIEHTSELGWKEAARAMPLIIDPGLHKNTKSHIFGVSPKRDLPTAFKLFTGSAYAILSREFAEYVIYGWDNLPRTLLMYYSNIDCADEWYFQTTICNSPEFVQTVVNQNMHYITWDTPPKMHPEFLHINDTANMTASYLPFARKFKHNDIVLNKIDSELLGRRNGSFTPGGWCAGKPCCSKVGNPTKIKRGEPGAERLTRLLARIVYSAEFRDRQCK